MKKHSRERQIERIIRLAWSSLESHLTYTYKHTPEGTLFHKKCVQEYAETINLASQLLVTRKKN